MRVRKIVTVIAVCFAVYMLFHVSCRTEAATKATTNENSQSLVNRQKKYTESDLRYMTCIIYCEARGECYAGKKAVGIVVMNRVKDDEFPDNIKDVIYQRGQFTPAANGSLNRALNLYDQQMEDGNLKGTMKKCRKAAKSALNGSTTVKVDGKKKQMKHYLFFSQYIPNAKYSLGGHQFK
ncbi:MAG: cell wall hydrolase [Lachnospiraceae bacterium]|nr:cell wall hydrolase [Lachnospiraceae bacterium]